MDKPNSNIINYYILLFIAVLYTCNFGSPSTVATECGLSHLPVGSDSISHQWQLNEDTNYRYLRFNGYDNETNDGIHLRAR